jgi:nucleoside-diphosphate-sugar epimerase
VSEHSSIFLSKLQHNDIYSETKAQGEALVLSANGKSGLVTCAIRPSSIFGPGDRLLVPSLVSAARSGKMKVRPGNSFLLGTCHGVVSYFARFRNMNTEILWFSRLDCYIKALIG